MKLYKFDYRGTIGENVITVPTDSQFLIGIGNGDASSTAKLYDGATELSAMSDKIGDYTVFRFETDGAPSRKQYKGTFSGYYSEVENKNAHVYQSQNFFADIIIPEETYDNNGTAALKTPWQAEGKRPDKVAVRYRNTNGEALGVVTYHFASQVVSGGTLKVTWQLDDDFSDSEYACANIWFKGSAAYQWNKVAFKIGDSYTEIAKDDAEGTVDIVELVPYTQDISLVVICQKQSVAYRDFEGSASNNEYVPIVETEPTSSSQTIAITQDNAQEIERTVWKIGGETMEDFKSVYFEVDKTAFPTYDHVWQFHVIITIPEDFDVENPDHVITMQNAFGVLVGDAGEANLTNIFEGENDNNYRFINEYLDLPAGTQIVADFKVFEGEYNFNTGEPLAFSYTRTFINNSQVNS